jgi:phosphoribosylformimino-5-aminoimidazole carboxamide ribotide isomerase
MVTIPSIDIYNNQVVRLKKGLLTEKTVYGRSPADSVRWLESLGAQRIHVVDLAAAFGEERQKTSLKDISHAATVPLQIGGGLRTLTDIEELCQLGYSYVVLSSGCFLNPNFLKEAIGAYLRKLILALDLKGNKIAIKGWTETTPLTIDDFILAHQVPDTIPLLVTDISKDGLMEGPSFDLYSQLTERFKNPIMASGGVRNYSDIQALSAMNMPYAIMGKALYEEKLTTEEVQKCLQNASSPA